MPNHLADGVRVGLTRDSSHQGDNNECFHIAASLTDCVWVWWEKRLYRQHLLTTGTLEHSPTHQLYTGTLTYSPLVHQWYTHLLNTGTVVHSSTRHWYTLACYHLLMDSTLLLTDGKAMVAQVNQDLPNSALGSARESSPDLRRCISFLLGWCSLRSMGVPCAKQRTYILQNTTTRYDDCIL